MDYLTIVRHYEECFDAHGDCAKGVDWPNEKDAVKRYNIMLSAITKNEFSLLDIGCGTGKLLEIIRQQQLSIKYTGLDLSMRFVNHCKKKFSDNVFLQVDILTDDCTHIPLHDLVVMNGVFTEKRELSHEQMTNFFYAFLIKSFQFTKHVMAFNVMSKLVDWERDDLFYVSFDSLCNFLRENLSRHFSIRHDYGLYEYTVYVYKTENERY